MMRSFYFASHTRELLLFVQSPIEREDIQLWSEADRVLQEIIEEEQQQKLRQSKGFSR